MEVPNAAVGISTGIREQNIGRGRRGRDFLCSTCESTEPKQSRLQEFCCRSCFKAQNTQGPVGELQLCSSLAKQRSLWLFASCQHKIHPISISWYFYFSKGNHPRELLKPLGQGSPQSRFLNTNSSFSTAQGSSPGTHCHQQMKNNGQNEEKRSKREEKD